MEYIHQRVELMYMKCDTSSTTSDEDKEEFFTSCKHRSSRSVLKLEGYLNINSHNLSILASFPSLQSYQKS